jgi:hypothetical protein
MLGGCGDVAEDVTSPADGLSGVEGRASLALSVVLPAQRVTHTESQQNSKKDSKKQHT